MDAIAAITAVMLLVDLLSGVVTGVFASASARSLREDQNYSLTGAPPDPLSAGARVLHGVFVRGNEFVSDALRADNVGDHILNEDEPGNKGDSDTQEQEPDQ